MTESRKTSLQTALFWAYVVFALTVGIACATRLAWPWTAANFAMLAHNLYWRGAVNHWLEWIELWMRRRELILLEREMDDTDDEILAALPHSPTLVSLRGWMNMLHTKRREVIDRMDHLHRVLGITPLRSLRQAAND